MQSFLGGLNYYSRFIEDLAIYASILYELREVDFYEMSRNPGQKTGDEVHSDDEILTAPTDEKDKWDRAQAVFEILKNKIATAVILIRTGYRCPTSSTMPDLTVNEEEYQGLLLGFDLLSSMDRGRLITPT
ncbi:hypothetical protein PPTG_23349 [Phytophthora nicotianae INRA-310]|uniref:Reverse transcriptase n=1 Tax=Phytophthora nicotianae (strain INRA-310) TaxID=761204 RepID=W2Q0M4_PHYN3|nr:hypothetical protein PPTG_23349 [Phytophthora nicotianae INRA-310]ETN06753.1 hypothetical protein PPTG_23349 [Phytophthora nicotianae INRA-310]